MNTIEGTNDEICPNTKGSCRTENYTLNHIIMGFVNLIPGWLHLHRHKSRCLIWSKEDVRYVMEKALLSVRSSKRPDRSEEILIGEGSRLHRAPVITVVVMGLNNVPSATEGPGLMIND